MRNYMSKKKADRIIALCEIGVNATKNDIVCVEELKQMFISIKNEISSIYPFKYDFKVPSDLVDFLEEKHDFILSDPNCKEVVK